jgi:DNA repair photolyase
MVNEKVQLNRYSRGDFMGQVLHISRRSLLLRPSTIACLSGIPTINLTAGCAHGCLYCYTRGYSVYPGEGKIKIYSDTLTKLQQELPRKRKRPAAVYFSPSSDMFQPVPEVLELAYQVLQFLFANNVGVAFLTKGKIPDPHMDILKANPGLVRAQVGLTTMDAGLLGRFEPNAASPQERLEQARQLMQAGIITQVRLDPILPGVTDDMKTLDELLREISHTGVREVAASTLFLRTPIINSLKRHLKDQPVLDDLLENFSSRCYLNMRVADPQGSRIMTLPIQKRKAIYDRVKRAAESYGINVKVCACKNPDMDSEHCSIAGDWSHLTPWPLQQALFDIQGTG